MRTKTGFERCRGERIESLAYRVGAWCPNDEGVNPTEVHLQFPIGPGQTCLLSFKSHRAIQEMIDTLSEYRDQVWPQH